MRVCSDGCNFSLTQVNGVNFICHLLSFCVGLVVSAFVAYMTIFCIESSWYLQIAVAVVVTKKHSCRIGDVGVIA